MTDDPRRPTAADSRGHTSFDDEAIGQLVRESASGWTMPPVRLDGPSWRDRVRSPRARRAASARGWFGRVGQAASAAVALTVAGAIVAVVVTSPPNAGGSAEPSAGATERSTEAAPSPLPQLVVRGAVPDPSRVVVWVDGRDFALVDLENGTLGGSVTGANYGSELRRLADGSLLCLCLRESGNLGTKPTDIEVTLERFDGEGSRVTSTPIETFTGAGDPRDADTFVPERPPHVLTAMSWSIDGRYGFVGWSLRAHPVWKSGILVIDVDDGRISDRIELPDRGTGEGDARVVVEAPRVVGAPGRGRAQTLLIGRSWYEWQPVASETANFRPGAEAFSVTTLGSGWTEPASIIGSDDCGDTILRAGVVEAGDGTASGPLWLACSTGGSVRTTIRRFGPDGTLLGDVRLAGQGGVEGDMTAVSPDGTKLFTWNPSTATLTRVDLETGETATGQGPLPVARTAGPLSAFGDWLAPTVAAKSFLQGAVVVSPDGSRVYAIGVQGGTGGPEPNGSSGVFVFDADSLASVGNWPPTADFISLGLGDDGKYLYAAGMPGVDVDGHRWAAQGASITVFDTTDGSIRLIAGALGRNMILFPATMFE